MSKLDLLKQNPLRVLYYVQGHILWFLSKYFILKFLRRSYECKPCYDSGFCVHCGCPVGPLFLSSLKCNYTDGKLENNTD